MDLVLGLDQLIPLINEYHNDLTFNKWRIIMTTNVVYKIYGFNPRAKSVVELSGATTYKDRLARLVKSTLELNKYKYVFVIGSNGKMSSVSFVNGVVKYGLIYPVTITPEMGWDWLSLPKAKLMARCVDNDKNGV